MNKRVFYLVLVLLVIITLFDMKIFLNTKKSVLEENSYLISLESKVKKVAALKEKYKFNETLFNRLKSMCQVNNKEDTYLINCTKLDASKFNTIQNIIFKNNFKIKNFDITKDKLATIKAEIFK